MNPKLRTIDRDLMAAGFMVFGHAGDRLLRDSCADCFYVLIQPAGSGSPAIKGALPVFLDDTPGDVIARARWAVKNEALSPSGAPSVTHQAGAYLEAGLRALAP